MRLRFISLVGFAAGFAGLGVLGLLNGDFALAWQPVPPGIPLRSYLAYASGLILLGTGVGMLVPTAASIATRILSWFVFSWLILLQLPRVVAHPGDVGAWLGFCETTVLVAGGWTLCVFAAQRDGLTRGRLLGGRAQQTARICFALALLGIGLSHFVYINATASMVPAWLPLRRGFAYLTGSGHVAAGIALLIGVVPRIAAAMEAAMITAFVLLLHAPAVVREPGSRLQWTMFCVAIALGSAAWAIAASFADDEIGRRAAAVDPAPLPLRDRG